MALWARGIAPAIPHRNTEHGSGLGKRRWVVERTISWLRQFKRLRVRYDRRADIHSAFLTLGCALICWRRLKHEYF
jgi:transposase